MLSEGAVTTAALQAIYTAEDLHASACSRLGRASFGDQKKGRDNGARFVRLVRAIPAPLPLFLLSLSS